ncbi:MAG TPA: DUF5317 domain-containing protein [Chloroflexota bacterium]|nr:DUF5317 domain-containing protein [Chloroflexota bacterium]
MLGLAQLRLRGLWLIVAGLAAQVVAAVSAGSWPAVANFRPAIIVVAYLLVLAGLARNWRIPGMLIVLLGFAMNFAPILANGGQMPVSRETMEAAGEGGLVANVAEGQPVFGSKDVLLSQEHTRLWMLSDTLIIPPPIRRVVSWGDFVTYAGMAYVIVLAMRRGKAQEQHSEPALAAA